MAALKFYTQDDKYVIERITEFNHSTKRFFDTPQQVKKAILEMPFKVIKNYEIHIERGVKLEEHVIRAFVERNDPITKKESPLH